MARKEYTGGAASAKLTAGITNAPATVAIDTAAGWPVGTYPFIAVLDRGVAGKEEKKRFLSRSGTTLTVDTGGNGVDGTAAVAHDAGATIEHALDAESLTDFARHVYDTTSDDHTQYLNIARHDITARHAFGGALGAPGTPANVSTVASAGAGGAPAREDHVHILAAGVAGDGLALTAGVLSVGVDGSTLEIVTDQLRVKDDGVTGAKLAPAVAGSGLVQDGSGNLDVNADNSTLEVVADALRVKSGGITHNELLASLPRGRVASALDPNPQVGITFETDLTNMSVTFTAVSGRRYKITAYAELGEPDGDVNGVMFINIAGVNVQSGGFTTQGGGAQHPVHLSYFTNSLSGSTTIKLRAARTLGGGTVSTGAVKILIVEDIGT